MLVAFLIFITRIISAILSTLTQVLMTRNNKITLIIISTLDITFWFFTTRYVLTTDTNFITIFLYILGFSLGTYLGIIIEEKISYGYWSINITTKNKDLAKLLRKEGYPISLVEAYNKNILLCELPKKQFMKFRESVFKYDPLSNINVVDALILINGYKKSIKQ